MRAQRLPRSPWPSRRRPGYILRPAHRHTPCTDVEPVFRWIPAFAGMTPGLAPGPCGLEADKVSRALRRDAEVFVLVENAVERMLVVLLDLEDADLPIGDVAVFVKADLALQRLGFRGLDRVADIGAVDLLAPFGNALHRIEDDESRVVGGDRVVFRLLTVFLGEALDPGLGLRILQQVRGGDRRIKPLGRRKAGALQDL